MVSPFTKEKSVYKIQEVQELFGVSRGTIINRLNDGVFTGIKPKGSRLVYINCDEVNRYFNEEELLRKNETITKKEISKQYYNKVKQLEDITLDNYLEENKKRNKNLGVFQLNLEIFKLKGKLEDLIDKIVMDKKIIIKGYLDNY